MDNATAVVVVEHHHNALRKKAGVRPIKANDFITKDMVTIVVFIICLTGKFGFFYQ